MDQRERKKDKSGKEEEDILAVLKEHYEDRYDDFKKILVDSGITTYLDIN